VIASDRGQGDRGSVTVEFAVALPVVTLVLVSLVAGVVLADRAGRLQDTAGAAARALGRGDDGAAATAVSSGAPGASSSIRRSDGLVCVDLRAAAPGPFALLPLRATGCAAEGGR
jgi:Flp pilus assembly protein TadG